MKKISTKLQNLILTGDKDFSEIIRHSFWAFGALGIATGSQFLFDLALARNFGAEGSGTFYLVLSIVSIAALFSRLGLDKSVIRFLPPLLISQKLSASKGLVSTTIKITVTNGLVLTIGILIFAPFIATELFSKPELASFIRILAIGIIPFALIYVYAGILRAMKLVKESLILERAVIYVIGLASIFVLGAFLGLKGVFWGFVCAVFVGALVGALMYRKNIPKSNGSVAFNKRVLLLSATPLLFSAFSNLMFGQVNVLLLGALSTVESVGIFNVALKVSLLMGIILVGISSISATKISELHSNKDSLEKLVSKTAALGIVLAIPIAALFIAAPQFILGLFGPEFTSGSTALIILVIGQLFSIFVGSANYVLAMTGNENSLATITFASLILNAGLSILLIGSYGAVGASIAIAVSMAVSNIWQVLVIKQKLGVWSLPFTALRTWLIKLQR